MKSFVRWIRLVLGLSVVPEVCEASRGGKDYHDYHHSKGGDGIPSHCYQYTCWNCRKKFWI